MRTNWDYNEDYELDNVYNADPDDLHASGGEPSVWYN
jgi:hypothetical protein